MRMKKMKSYLNLRLLKLNLGSLRLMFNSSSKLNLKLSNKKDLHLERRDLK